MLLSQSCAPRRSQLGAAAHSAFLVSPPRHGSLNAVGQIVPLFPQASPALHGDGFSLGTLPSVLLHCLDLFLNVSICLDCVLGWILKKGTVDSTLEHCACGITYRRFQVS